MVRRVAPWMTFVACLSLLILSTSSFAQTVDWLLWPIRFGLIAGLSVVLLWSRWRHRSDKPSHNARKDFADGVLSSARSWYYGDSKPPK